MISIIRLTKSFGYALKGLYKVFREEQNVRIETMAAVVVLAAGAILEVSRLEWCILIFAICLVILMEIVNSAIERVADALKPRIDKYSKELKDIMAAAVMLSSLAAVAVGILIFYPYLFGSN